MATRGELGMATLEERTEVIEPDQEPPALHELPPLPPIGRAARLYADTRTHRAVPLHVALAATRARSEVFWRRSAGGRQAALAAMELVVGCCDRAGEVETLARRHVYETAKRSELLWRPWETRRLPIEGAEVLSRLRNDGRGALLHFLHHGPYVGITGSFARAGLPRINAPIGPFYFEMPTPGYHGHRDRQHLSCLYDGGRCFSATGSFGRIVALLERGENVAIAIDMPGTTPVEILGRRVLVSGGIVKLALKTGAPIVPMTMHRRGRIATVRLEEPVEPAGFDGVEALTQELVRRHEPALHAWPEALEWPLQRWTPA